MSHRRQEIEITLGLQEYLTAILRLKKKGKKVVRVKELAEEMKVKLSSVTDAAKRLSRMGLIQYERYGYIDLTPKGEEVALRLSKREEILLKFLSEILRLDENVVREEACWMEHGVSEATIDRLSQLIEFLGNCVDKFDERFSKYLEYRKC